MSQAAPCLQITFPCSSPCTQANLPAQFSSKRGDSEEEGQELFPCRDGAVWCVTAPSCLQPLRPSSVVPSEAAELCKALLFTEQPQSCCLCWPILHIWLLVDGIEHTRSSHTSPGQDGSSSTLIILPLVHFLKFLSTLKKKKKSREIDNNDRSPQKSSVPCSHLLLFAEHIDTLVEEAQQLSIISSTS